MKIQGDPQEQLKIIPFTILHRYNSNYSNDFYLWNNNQNINGRSKAIKTVHES